ncbi:MAG: succinyl-CoA--3-ketoacid-CoA transferase [Thermoleophilia bacterium]|nr:succinyl-CoA--3-ketoacid-CoA transferase [Thermoleophilia bacterium]
MAPVARDGSTKIVKTCSLALTGERVANHIITDLAVFDVTPNGLMLREHAPGGERRAPACRQRRTLPHQPGLREMSVR